MGWEVDDALLGRANAFWADAVALGSANSGFAAVLDGRGIVLLGSANTLLAGVVVADNIVTAVLDCRGFEKETPDVQGRNFVIMYQEARVVRTYSWRGRSTEPSFFLCHLEIRHLNHEIYGFKNNDKRREPGLEAATAVRSDDAVAVEKERVVEEEVLEEEGNRGPFANEKEPEDDAPDDGKRMVDAMAGASEENPEVDAWSTPPLVSGKMGNDGGEGVGADSGVMAATNANTASFCGKSETEPDAGVRGPSQHESVEHVACA